MTQNANVQDVNVLFTYPKFEVFFFSFSDTRDQFFIYSDLNY